MPGFVTCHRCKGRGQVERIPDPKPMTPVELLDPSYAMQTVQIETISCPQCEGKGGFYERYPWE